MLARTARLLPIAVAGLAVVGAILFTELLDPSPKPVPAAAPEDVSLSRLGIALLVLVGIGAGAIALVRWSRASAGRRRGRARSVEVLDVLALGGKRSLAVARVYDRVLVLGIGDGPVSLLTEVRDEERGEAEAPAASAAAQEPFRHLLARMTAVRKPEPERARPVEVPSAPRRRTIAFTGATSARERARVEELL